jgi:hypothetical protein
LVAAPGAGGNRKLALTLVQGLTDFIVIPLQRAPLGSPISHLKGMHRPYSNAPVIATRYDKLAVNFLSAVALATTISFWL